MRRALSRAPLIQALDADVDAARAEELAARAWRNPSASYALERTRGGGDTATEHVGSLSVPLELSGARGLRAEAAEARVRAARENARGDRIVIAAEARRRFHAVLWRDARAEARRRAAARLDAVATAAAQREARGDVSRFDVARISLAREAERAGAEAEAAASTRARVALAEIVGAALSDAGAMTLAGALAPEEPPKLDHFLDRIAGLPGLEALRAEQRAGELAARAAGRWWLPPLEVGAGLKYVEEGGSSATGPVFGISIPLPLLDRSEAETLRARSEASGAGARARLLEASAAATIAGLHAEAAALAGAAARSSGDAGARRAVLLDAADAGYRGGELGAMELVDAYRAALEAELQQLDLAWTAREARIALDEAAGLAGDEEPNS